MIAADSLAFPPHVGDDGIWCQLVSPLDGPPRPALFLDRDGVIVDEVLYLHRIEDMQLVDGAAEVIRRANEEGFPVIIVTNQSGVGRGMYGWPEFAAVQDAMLRALAAQTAFVNAVFACPFHGDGVAPWNVDDHPDRKPGPGMLTRAAAMFPIDLGTSWIIGDRAGDLGAGRHAGLAGGMHVMSVHGEIPAERSAALAHQRKGFQVLTGDSTPDFLSHGGLFQRP